jgi:hypothetical protein
MARVPVAVGLEHRIVAQANAPIGIAGSGAIRLDTRSFCTDNHQSRSAAFGMKHKVARLISY